MAATPPPPAIRRSIRTTSGSSRATRSTPATPSGASPRTRNPGSESNMPRRPSRTTGWSSTTTSVMTRAESSAMAGQPYWSSAVPDQGHPGADRRTAPRFRLHLDGARDAFGAGPHAAEPELPAPRRRGPRAAGSKPRPSSRTSRASSSSMKDRVMPTRAAPAWRPALARASSAMRSRVAAISSWTGSAVPVTVNSARTPWRSPQPVTVFFSAPTRSSCSSATGTRSWTERRASFRLCRARATARSRCCRARAGSVSAIEVTT